MLENLTIRTTYLSFRGSRWQNSEDESVTGDFQEVVGHFFDVVKVE
jgi:hypothetical protein